MNVQAARRKVLSGIVVALVLLGLIVPSAMAATAPPLSLPPGQITASHSLLFDPALPANWPASFDIVLSGFSGNYNVAAGVDYPGWCLEDDMPTPDPTLPNVFLYSSYDPNMPANAKNYTDPQTPKVVSGQAALNSPVPWDRLNYLLNHKLGTIEEIQSAIWLLMWGATSLPVTANVTSMVNAANSTAAAGFVPAAGQIIAVLLWDDGIGFTYPTFIHQESIIELTVPPFYDRGDLPFGIGGAPNYPTYIAQSGPSHLIGPGLFLGQCVDAEADGQGSNATATGDNLGVGAPGFGNVNPPPAGPGYGTCAVAGNDEDGVARNMSDKWTPGATVRLDVTVQGSGQMACWIDWNNSGNLGDNSNKFINIGPVSTGSIVVNVTVPSTGYTVGNPLYVRCRLFPTDGVPGGTLTLDDYIGSAPGGEVEDYYWTFGPNAVTLSGMTASSAATPLALPLGLVTLLGLLVGGIVLARRPI